MMVLRRLIFGFLLLATSLAQPVSVLPLAQADGILMLATAGSSRVIDIERDLGCVPAEYGDAATFQPAVAAANTTKLQEAFDEAAATPGPRTLFVIPSDRCYAIGTTPLQLRGGQALVGMGGNCPQNAENRRRGRTAEPVYYINGSTLMRVEESTNPMILLTGYGNVIENVNLRGAYWSTDVQFTKPGVGNYAYPYYAGTGIEIRNTSDEDALTGKHQISGSIAFCTKGISFTYTGEQQQADGCTISHMDMFEVFTAIEVNNEQALSNYIAHLVYQIPSMAQGAGLAPSGTCKVLSLVNGGSVTFGDLALYGAPDTTTTGECIVVEADATQTNCCCVTICSLFIDAGCLRRGREFRIAKMVNAEKKDLFLRILGGQFALGVNSVTTQWYNVDGSALVDVGVNDPVGDPDSTVQIKMDMFGLSTADKALYGWANATHEH